MATPSLRPLEFGEILDAAFSVLRRNFWTFVIVAVIPSVIGAAAIGFLTTSITRVRASGSGGQLTTDELNALIGGVALTLLVSVLTSQIATAALYKAVVDTYIDGTARAGDALRFALRRLPSLLWITLLYGLGVGLGFVLFVIPGVILYASWSLAIPVLMSENARGTKALKRSRWLVKGRWWGVFGLLVVTMLIAGIFGEIVSALVGLLIDKSGRGTTQAGISAFASTLITSTVTGPLTAAVTAVLYIDQRVRKEGLDVQLLLAGSAAADPPTGA